MSYMSEISSEIPQFDPERYKGQHIDFVHIESLRRIVDGKKPADITTTQDARAILKRYEHLLSTEVTIRNIENPSLFEPLQEGQKPILGGAFDGQCLKDYQEAAKKAGVDLTPDPWLTLRLD